MKYRRHRGDMIEVFKILHGIYDRDITEGILQLAQNTRTRGHSLKLTTQSSRLELRRNCFLSGSWNHGTHYQKQLCPRQVWRCLKQDWMKRRRTSLFGLTTKKSYSSSATIWI